MTILNGVMNASSHSMFIVNKDGIITNINDQAKHRFGLFNQSKNYHAAGKLEKGDIVIIGDTAIGADDDRLAISDLKKIGIQDKNIQQGDMIIAVGTYENEDKKAVYKYVKGNAVSMPTLNFQTLYNNIDVAVTISSKLVSVTVNGETYDLSYFLCIGQMVIINPETGEVKFWEEKGYSARKEGIGSILRGGLFKEKKPNGQIDVVGYYFRDFFDGMKFEKDLDDVLEGRTTSYLNVKYDVNGYMITGTILPLYENNKLEGALVKFRRIEDIRDTIEERNEAIKIAESTYKSNDNSNLRADNQFSGIFGNGTAMAVVRKYAYKLSQIDCNILITGESGTGKSMLAGLIKDAQMRKGSYVVVDCSTISSNLFESEMFGYEGGAFTGANAKGKKGFFEVANGGTIFLDEIGEIPIDIQAKLLNVIQNKTICRVGGTQTIPIDVRIIAATNRDLKKSVAEGLFRSDLYYRLTAFSLELPPLRECKEDIFFIISNLMESIKIKYNTPNKSLSGETFSKLIAYDWPGNIRELENVLESAVALSDSDIIYPEDIRLEVDGSGNNLRDMLRREEERIIRRVLAENDGNRQLTMKKLGITKTIFYQKLKDYGIK